MYTTDLVDIVLERQSCGISQDKDPFSPGEILPYYTCYKNTTPIFSYANYVVVRVKNEHQH